MLSPILFVCERAHGSSIPSPLLLPLYGLVAVLGLFCTIQNTVGILGHSACCMYTKKRRWRGTFCGEFSCKQHTHVAKDRGIFNYRRTLGTRSRVTLFYLNSLQSALLHFLQMAYKMEILNFSMVHQQELKFSENQMLLKTWKPISLFAAFLHCC